MFKYQKIEGIELVNIKNTKVVFNASSHLNKIQSRRFLKPKTLFEEYTKDFRFKKSGNKLTITKIAKGNKELELNVKDLDYVQITRSDLDFKIVENIKETFSENEIIYKAKDSKINMLSTYIEDIDFELDKSHLVFKDYFLFINANFEVYNGSSINEQRDPYKISGAKGYIHNLTVLMDKNLENTGSLFLKENTYINKLDICAMKNNIAELQVINNVTCSFYNNNSIRIIGNPKILIMNSYNNLKVGETLYKNKEIKHYPNPYFTLDNIENDEAIYSLKESKSSGRLMLPVALTEEIDKRKKRKEKLREAEKSLMNIDLNRYVSERKDELDSVIRESDNKIDEYLELLKEDYPTDKITKNNRKEVIDFLKGTRKTDIQLNDKQRLNLKKLCILFDLEYKREGVIF